MADQKKMKGEMRQNKLRHVMTIGRSKGREKDKGKEKECLELDEANRDKRKNL